MTLWIRSRLRGTYATGPSPPIRATSASTAIATKLAAEIQSEYPNIRPETVRGLMVHSARWNETMLNGANPHRQGTRGNVTSILRRYGYGEPDAARTRKSASNAVTLFREESLRPFTNDRKLNDCHIHTLPIPSNYLDDPIMGGVIMRATLYYFVASSPSANSRIPGSRYRYAGCLLRFDARNVNESEEAFINRVGSIAAEDEAKRKNIPSVEQQSPKTLRYPRNTDLDPQIVWRGKDEQDWNDLVLDPTCGSGTTATVAEQ